MPTDVDPADPSFGELSRTECEQRLADHHVGRVAWNAPDGPQLLPVNYALYAGEVVIRTSPSGVLGQLTSRCPVAFEIDEVDEGRRAGWSVLVRGMANQLRQPYDVARLWSTEWVVPWAGGSRTVFVAITPRTISGRTVQATG